MGAGAYNRGSRAIRERIDIEQSKPSGLTVRDASNLRTAYGNAIDRADQQRQRADRAERELARARSLIERLRAEKAVLRQEIADQQKLYAKKHEFSCGLARALQSARRAHKVCSRVVRLGLTPERYHSLRQEIRETEGI